MIRVNIDSLKFDHYIRYYVFVYYIIDCRLGYSICRYNNYSICRYNNYDIYKVTKDIFYYT